MAVASFEELIGEKKAKVPSFEELAEPESPLKPVALEAEKWREEAVQKPAVPSFDELAPMPLPEFAAKSYLNKAVLQAAEEARPSSGTVQAVAAMTSPSMMKLIEKQLKETEGQKKATILQGLKAFPEMWWAFTKMGLGIGQGEEKAREAEAVRGLKELREPFTYEVPPETTTGRKVAGVGTGLAAFLTQILIAKKIVPAGTVLPEHVAWEMVNRLEGGVPGQGAITRGALGAIGTTPTRTLKGKVAKTAAESGLFAGLTAAGGGSTEDIIVSALVPVAFNSWNFAKQRNFLTKYERGLRQEALANHHRRVRHGMQRGWSEAYYQADMRKIDAAVLRAKRQIYHDDAFAPSREKWQAERQRQYDNLRKGQAKGDAEMVKRANETLAFLEGEPAAPMPELMKAGEQMRKHLIKVNKKWLRFRDKANPAKAKEIRQEAIKIQRQLTENPEQWVRDWARRQQGRPPAVIGRTEELAPTKAVGHATSPEEFGRMMGQMKPSEQFAYRLARGQIEAGRERSAIAEQQRHYNNMIRRAVSEAAGIGQAVPPATMPQAKPVAPKPPTKIEQARREAAKAIEKRMAEVAKEAPEVPVLAQRYSQMEDILGQLDTEQNQHVREQLLDQAERIDRDITELSNLQEKNLTELHKLAKKLGVKAKKGAGKAAMIKLLAGTTDLSQIQRTETGYRVETPIVAGQPERGTKPKDFETFAEAAYFLQRQPTVAPKPTAPIQPEKPVVAQPLAPKPLEAQKPPEVSGKAPQPAPTPAEVAPIAPAAEAKEEKPAAEVHPNIVKFWLPNIRTKLTEMRVKNLSDAELARAFKGTAAENRLNEYAKLLRDSGHLKPQDVGIAAPKGAPKRPSLEQQIQTLRNNLVTGTFPAATRKKMQQQLAKLERQLKKETPKAKEPAKIAEGRRRTLLREAYDEVKKTAAWAEHEGSAEAYAGGRLGPISEQVVYISPKYKGEIEAYFGEKGKTGSIPKLWSRVTFDRATAKSSWDQAAQERGMEDASLDDYLQAMLDDYKARPDSRKEIPDHILDKLTVSREWQDVALAARIQMIRSGNYSEQDIKDEIETIRLDYEAGRLDDIDEADYDREIGTIPQTTEVAEKELEAEREAIRGEGEAAPEVGEDFLAGLEEEKPPSAEGPKEEPATFQWPISVDTVHNFINYAQMEKHGLKSPISALYADLSDEEKEAFRQANLRHINQGTDAAEEAAALADQFPNLRFEGRRPEKPAEQPAAAPTRPTKPKLDVTEQKNAFIVNGTKFPKAPFHGGLNMVKLPKGMSMVDVERTFGFNMGQEAGIDTFRELVGLAAPEEEAPPAPKLKKPAPPQIETKRIASLRKMADTLQNQIDNGRREMTQNPTPKRMRQYYSRVHDADNMERTQKAMRAMADALEKGELPAVLADVKTKDAVARLVRKGTLPGGYYEVIPSKEYADKSEAGKALQAMIEKAETGEDKAARELREKREAITRAEEKMRFGKIPGFFPTPRPVIDDMIERAEIDRSNSILEPSAGKGDIADALEEDGYKTDVAEIRPALQEILRLKGHNIVGSDFLELDGKWDRIIMNPPYEKGQDIDHVRHAYELLNPGGKLVALMSEGSFFRTDKKSTAFRDWLEYVGGTSEKLPPKSFAGIKTFRQTGVAIRLVVISKPRTAREAPPAPSETVDDQLRRIEAMPEGPEKEAEWLRMATEQVLAEEVSEAEKAAKEILEKNGITDVPVKTVKHIPLPDEGEFIPFQRRGKVATGAAVTRAQKQAIFLALGADSETGYHEAYHILRTRLTAKDLTVLTNHYGYDAEETEAGDFARYVKKERPAPTSLIQRVFNKLRMILVKIKLALNGRGFRTVEDIFGDIAKGRVRKVDMVPAQTRAFEMGLFGPQAGGRRTGTQRDFGLDLEKYRAKERIAEKVKPELVKAVDAVIERTLKPGINDVQVTPDEVAAELAARRELFNNPGNIKPEIRAAFDEVTKGRRLFETAGQRHERDTTRNARIQARVAELKAQAAKLVGKPATAKSATKQVGAAHRVLGIDAVVAKTQRLNGIDYELYKPSDPADGRGIVRVFDAEADETVTVRSYPTFASAEAEYDKAIKAEGRAERLAAKQPWQMDIPEATSARAEEAFPIESKVEVVKGKPVYTHTSTVQFGEERRTFEITSRGPLSGYESASRLHKEIVKAAASEGLPIPRNVLEEYKSEPWAQEALAKGKPGKAERLTVSDKIDQFQQKLESTGAARTPDGIDYKMVIKEINGADVPAFERVEKGERQTVVGFRGETFSSRQDAIYFAVSDAKQRANWEGGPKTTQDAIDAWAKQERIEAKGASWDLSVIGNQQKSYEATAAALRRIGWANRNTGTLSDRDARNLRSMYENGIIRVMWDKQGNSYFALLETPDNRKLVTKDYFEKPEGKGTIDEYGTEAEQATRPGPGGGPTVPQPTGEAGAGRRPGGREGAERYPGRPEAPGGGVQPAPSAPVVQGKDLLPTLDQDYLEGLLKDFKPEIRYEVRGEERREAIDKNQLYGIGLALKSLERGDSFILADGTGFGKTRQIIAVAYKHQQRTGKPSLIITANKEIIQGNFRPQADAIGVDLSKIEIGTYTGLRTGAVGKKEYGVVVFDESHQLKNYESGRAEAARAVKTDTKMYVTATPMDRPSGAAYFLGEISGVSREEMAHRLGFHFEQYTDLITQQVKERAVLDENHQWRDVIDNIVALRDQSIQKGNYLRREIPFKGVVTTKDITLPGDFRGREGDIQHYWQRRIDRARSKKARMNLSGQRTHELGRFTESQKAKRVFPAVLEDLKAGRKVIVVAEGINPTSIKGLGGETVQGFIGAFGRLLDEAGYDHAAIYGGGNKAAEIERFQNDQVQVALMTPQSGGVGVDLDDTVGDRPRTMYLVSMNFAGDQFEQIIGRVSRRNTKSDSEVFLVQTDSWSDRRRNEIATRKMRTLRAIQKGDDLDRAFGFQVEGEAGRAEILYEKRELPKAAAAAAKGYGTIASSEKGTFAAQSSPKRFRDEAPDSRGLAITDTLLSSFSPGSRELARPGARVLRENIGEFARETVLAQEALKKAHHAFTFMNRRAVYDFIDRMENGEPQQTPKLQEVAAKLRQFLDERRDAIRALGKGQLRHFYQNYFPHIWKDPSAAERVVRRILSRRPLEGPKSFLKKRTIVTIKEGREYGLELVSENPVDLVLLKLKEMDRYLMAQNIIQDLKSRGLIRFVYARSNPPDGYIKINDNAFTVYMPPEITKKEAYDSILVDQLMDIAKSLGIDTQRFVNIGGKRWGYAEWPALTPKTGPHKVRTKYAGPESVLAHEIGRILGAKYNLYETLRRAKEGAYKTIKKGKKVGEQRFVPEQAALDHRRTIDKEWRALADARFKNQPTGPGFKGYVRKAEEKEAVLLEALIHAPGEFKAIAPHLHDYFVKFLNAHSELRPILDIKPSLVLGESEAKIEIPGITTLGHYYAPEPVAKLLNNYLSPGLRNNQNKLIAGSYNLLRGTGNILNQAQLALSGFHALNVTTDMIASTLGQGLRELSVRGQRLRAVGHIASAPIAPAMRVWDGVRLKRAYKQQLDSIKDPRLRQYVEALVKAGGRDRMDPFYYNEAVKALKKTIGEVIHGSPVERILGVFALPYDVFAATLETLAAPLMQWYVPTGKLGLFAMMAEHEMQRAETGQITDEQLHERLLSSWDSVDNRMGQLTYDNLFWNRTLKDVSMLAVRSVGWNLGSWREYGGVPIDILGTKGRLARGDVWLSQKMAYSLGAVILYATIGAVVTYILTGKGPQELKDYFFPRTGKKNPDGSPERLSLPTYAKDWFAYGIQPVRTVKNKVHPIWGVLIDLSRNKDFFNAQIREPSDPVSKQLYDMMKFTAKEFLPLSARNYGKMSKAAPGQTGRNMWVSVTGITSAPAYISRTPAQKLMYRYIAENVPPRPKTKEEAERGRYRRDLENRLRKGEPIDRNEAIKRLGFRSWQRLMKEVRMDPFAESFGRLTLAQALNVYAIASDQEKAKVNILLRRKYFNARPETRTPEIIALYNELLQQRKAEQPKKQQPKPQPTQKDYLEGLPTLEELLAK